MPRVESGARAGVKLPGAYRKLLKQDCESRTMPDPREVCEMDRAEFARLEEAAAAETEMLFEERVSAGAPLEVARWRIGGHSIPVPKDLPMFRDRSIKSFTVCADDTIAPADRAG
jgi:hypothetical protein